MIENRKIKSEMKQPKKEPDKYIQVKKKKWIKERLTNKPIHS